MKERADALIAALGCEAEDQSLIWWNSSPGAIVLAERLLLRIQALERKVESLAAERPKALTEKVRLIEKADVPAST